MVGIPGGVGRAVSGAVRSGAGRLPTPARDDTVQLDLREQLRTISTAPQLPEAWSLDTATATAGGARFGGDVTVPVYDAARERLEVVTVDVSGKGLAAGTRALLLAGALSALMGVVDPQSLMSALNRHIHRQEWMDGFATAVHVGVDLTTGAFTVTGAGHPPAVHFHAGSGRWEVLEQQGTLLGVIEEGEWPVLQGMLSPGDALLFFTDGMVEQRGQHLNRGIDRLLGAADYLVVRGFENGAQQLIDAVASTGDDDRNISVLWRSPRHALPVV